MLYDNMPGSALDKVVTSAGDVLFERKTLTLSKLEASPGDRSGLRISGQPEEPHLLNGRRAEAFLISRLMKQVLKSPSKSTVINDLIKDSHKNTRKVYDHPVPHRDSENHDLQNGNLERHEVSKDRRSCSMPNMLQISKTRRDMLYLWKHSTRQDRGSQAASRETNQQSIHHVRPWSSQFSIEEYSQRLTLWKLCRIINTEGSTRLHGFRKETQSRKSKIFKTSQSFEFVKK